MAKEGVGRTGVQTVERTAAFPLPIPKRKEGKRLGRRSKVVINALALLALIEGAGTIVSEQINDQPVSAQTVKAGSAWPWSLSLSAIQDVQRVLNREAPSTFSVTAERGVIGENTIVRLPQEEIDKLFPTAFGKLREDGDNTILTIPQPISKSEREKAERAGVIVPDQQYEIREDKGTLQLQYPLDLSQSSDPNAQIPFAKSYGGLIAADRLASLQKEGYYDTLEFQNVPKGTIVQAPLDGYLVISRTNGVRHDPNKVTNGFIDFQGPNGIIYRLLIYGGEGNDIFVFTPLLDAPEPNPGDNHKPVGAYGIHVEKGQALFRTDSNLDEVGLKITMAIKGKVGEPPDGRQPYVPTNLEMLPSLDGKLLTSQK